MAKIKKKGTSGNAKNYITRSQAIRKLQISLPDFRRLCIFKGIYPREPRSKKRASRSATPSTTFYYTKDIQYLLHEPLLAKFRDQKALAKKISKALGRNEINDASRLERNLTPRITLDHIIKQRYPTFIDALRDLDDALSMLYLFANLPSTESVPPKTITKCQRLTMEFEHYLIRSHSLRKSFLSIKGIYYQATIQGEDILWLVPYKFVQRTAGEVDFRIMATFVEFYTTLLGFINYRLYTSIGLVYPPKFDAESEDNGAELGAFQLEDNKRESSEESNEINTAATSQRAQAEADKLLAQSGTQDQLEAQIGDDVEGIGNGATHAKDLALDQFESIDPAADTLLQPSMTADVSSAAKLFEPLTFFISREAPRHPLEFILKAFGCKRVGWSSLLGEAGSYCQEEDTKITHQIVDRPDLPLPSPPPTDEEETEPNNALDDGAAPSQRSNERVPGRIYVQPQWVWDCINAGKLQRPDLYAPGAVLPPHFSPWMKPKKGEYDPTQSLADEHSATALEDEESDDEPESDDGSSDGAEENHSGHDKQIQLSSHVGKKSSREESGMDVQLADSDDSDNDVDGDEDVARAPNVENEWGGFSDEDGNGDPVIRVAREHQAELEAEARGQSIKLANSKELRKSAKNMARAKRSEEQAEAAADLERRKGMMPRRKRKMFDKMQYSNAQKEQEVDKLKAKKRKIDKGLARQRSV